MAETAPGPDRLHRQFPILHYIHLQRRVAITGLLLMLLNAALTLAHPWIAGKVGGALVADSWAGSGLLMLLLTWFLLITGRSFVDYRVNSLLGSATETVAAELRSRLYEQMQIQDMETLQEQDPGETLTLLSNDAELVSSLLTDTVIQLLPVLLTLAGILGLMLWLDPPLALAAILLVPLYLLCIRSLGRRIKPLSKSWLESYGDMLSLAEENIRMLPAIKAFGREAHELSRFSERNQRLLSHSQRQAGLEALLPASMAFLTGSGMLLLLALGSLRLQQGHIDIAALLSLLLYAALLASPLRALADAYTQFQRGRSAIERLLNFLHAPVETDDNSLPELVVTKGAIEFSDIDFSYGEDTPVLEQLHMKIDPGETVAITGANGAGKSTLAHLLMRFYSPQQGSIRIDNQDLGEVSLTSLRRQVRLLGQNTLLLNASVSDNISYANPGADSNEVEAAARAAQAHEFIARLPEGYDTLIGKEGYRLSGGQRQRIALARVLLQTPAILILDEATSMLDPAAEEAFIDDCRALFEDRTVVMISHRQSSLALADRVLKLELGKVRE